MTDHVIAVYGTLRRGGRNHHLIAPAQWLGTGTVAGRLHVVRESAQRSYVYPVLLDDDGTGAPVVVELYRVVDPGMLVALDALERYDPLDEERSEYVRRAVRVHGVAAVTEAEAYLYRGDPEQVGASVPGGDWFLVRPGS